MTDTDADAIHAAANQRLNESIREPFHELCARFGLLDDADLKINIGRRTFTARRGGKAGQLVRYYDCDWNETPEPDWEALWEALADTPQQRALPRPATTPPMWAQDPTKTRRRR